MNEEQEPVTINGDGIVATICALLDHLEALDVLSREGFATELRTRSMAVGPELGRQLLAMAEGLNPKSVSRFDLIEGGKSDDDGKPDAA